MENTRLSPRECQVVALIAQAKPNKEIACELGLTTGTVKVYISRIFDKLGLSNRTEVAIWLISCGQPVRQESTGQINQIPDQRAA